MKKPPRKTPTREEFYMGMALWYASKSKDPATQCGAVIISAKNEPLGWGYNGPPRQMKDTAIDWSRPAKYPFIKHAEHNAIKYSCGSLENATLYGTGKPCEVCMGEIVEHGITRVIYFHCKQKLETDKDSMLADPKKIGMTDTIARLGGVELVKFSGNLNWMRDRIQWMEVNGIFG